jgi:hypothetical protein
MKAKKVTTDNELSITDVSIAESSPIPHGSMVEKYLPADYSDAFALNVKSDVEFTPDDIMITFWTGQAGWVRSLFRLRNFLVRFVGLKGSEGFDVKEFTNAIREGGSYGFTSIPARNDQETLMLLTDKHLDAWLSIHIASRGECKTISAITVVHFKNRLGRVYFFMIRPFHAIIVKSTLKRAINKSVK